MYVSDTEVEICVSEYEKNVNFIYILHFETFPVDYLGPTKTLFVLHNFWNFMFKTVISEEFLVNLVNLVNAYVRIAVNKWRDKNENLWLSQDCNSAENKWLACLSTKQEASGLRRKANAKVPSF